MAGRRTPRGRRVWRRARESDPLPTTSPPASAAPIPTELHLGQTFALVFDPDIGRVVLINGATEQGPDLPTELWSWSGSAWELLDASGPPARSFAAVARDPVRGTIVVHGGLPAGGEIGDAFDETIEWDGRDWSVRAVTEAGPGPREGAGLAFDADAGKLVLFGGSVGSDQQADTWTWDGTTWSLVAETGPRPRFVSLMTEDRATGGIVLQGGHWVDGDDGDFLADTWRWDDGAWQEATDGDGPGPRVNSPGTWDDRLEGVVMFGGGTGMEAPFGADTWLWRDAWAETPAEVGPSPRNGHALAYDTARGVLVLAGGIDRPGGTQVLDVWELDADGWSEVMAPTIRASPRRDGAGSVDGLPGVVRDRAADTGSTSGYRRTKTEAAPEGAASLLSR